EEDKQKYRLPTEAEWEWAARCGSAGMFAWGDDWHAGGDYEWYDVNSEGHTHPVGQKRPNAWGLYDSNGNVVEWCGDWHLNPFPQADVSDPTGPFLSGGARVLRGGSFMDAATPYTNRGSFSPAISMIHCGFRVCREL
ncbi:MAG TPA: SUMF1/EgtB/PvdO family nonheme iron enzyme, partial [Pirellulales bacterium]|nr:SUMF1/EgtB/PvdO family nonheme iron enzyme [Pirellulales bacterium]